LAQLLGFVGSEPECLVLDDRTAGGRTIFIADVLRSIAEVLASPGT
jgi:hypothetical protein